MSSLAKLLAAATVVVLAVGGSVLFFSNRSSGPGGVPPASVAPSASPSPSAMAEPSPTPELMDTTGWVSYSSERYGLTIARPGDWADHPAQRDWAFPDDAKAWEHLEATEVFANDTETVGVSAWSSTVAPGTTVEAWMQEYCVVLGASGCASTADLAVDVETADGHPGLLQMSGDTMAFFLDGETMYVVAVWREDTDPTVQPYGGARRLLKSFISTLTLEAPSSSPAPSP